MTIQACRESLLEVSREKGAHPGLLLSRFLRIPVQDEEKEHPEERLNLFRAVQTAQQSTELQQLYQLAFTRRQQALQDATQTWVTVHGRIIIGLGEESVLETGITLHHTYGVPILPGSALKGLAAHYCDQVWGAQHPEFKKEVYEEGHEKPRSGQHHQILFGTNENSGHIIFQDAWIRPDSLIAPNQGLVLDVMTPHHSEYYMAKDETAPTDFDSPTPLLFLSVAGTFHIAVSCDVTDANGKAWELRALHLLTQALATWGVGGKTNVGYGRMSTPSQTSPFDGKEQQTTQLIGPRYKVGERITVRRVEDPKGKGRVWFQADDGLKGRVTQGDEPLVQMGETVSLWIAAVSKDSYNFSANPPPSSQRSAKKERQRR